MQNNNIQKSNSEPSAGNDTQPNVMCWAVFAILMLLMSMVIYCGLIDLDVGKYFIGIGELLIGLLLSVAYYKYYKVR
jgi:hypothetical protein